MLFAAGVSAAELRVGAGRALQTPGEAARQVSDGDTVLIDPGVYTDCAVWRTSRLRIEAAGPGVVLAGKTCAGKGIFIIQGNDITVRGITFADATVPDHNGAGIRAEGRNLTVERSRFLHNENGILAGGGPDSTLWVSDSEFIGNGACIGACAHGLYVGGPLKLLVVERSIFREQHVAHHIKSRALATIVRGCTIEDGPRGTASYLIDIPSGGDALIEHNTMEKGPNSENPLVAITIGEEGVRNPTNLLVIRNNVFRNDLPRRTVFVRDQTAQPVELRGNRLIGDVQEYEGPARTFQ